MKKLSGIAHGDNFPKGTRLRASGKARLTGQAYYLPLGRVANRGGGYVSGFHPLHFNPPWQWGRIALPCIVPLICSFPHARTRGRQSKRVRRAYKRRISYQVRGSGRGGQGESQHESQLSAPRGAGQGHSETAAASQRNPPQPANRLSAHDPHPTGVGTHLLLARAASHEKYPISNTLCKK